MWRLIYLRLRLRTALLLAVPAVVAFLLTSVLCSCDDEQRLLGCMHATATISYRSNFMPTPSHITACARSIQGKIIDAMEILVITFVLEDIAVTFQLSSVEKGLIGSTSFFGGSWTRARALAVNGFCNSSDCVACVPVYATAFFASVALLLP